MEYYSLMEIDEDIKQFDNEKFNRHNPYPDEVCYNEEKKHFDVYDAYGKWYDDDLLAAAMAAALKEGSISVYFTGEDGEKWKYEISPGNVACFDGEVKYHYNEDNSEYINDKVKEYVGEDTDK